MLTPKTRFSRRKDYFISEIVFYSRNLRFWNKKLVEIPVFIRLKRPFRNKKYQYLHRKRGFHVEKSIIYLKYYFTVENSDFVEKNL